MMLLNRLLVALAATAVLLGAAAPARALAISPLQVELVSVGTQSRSQITVTNDGTAPVPVEAYVERLTLDETGKRKTEKAGEQFLIFPPQAIIPAGGTQVFRVQWVGDPAIARSESYLMTVRHVPLKSPKGRNTVQVVLGFGIVINVAPAEGASALKLVGTGVTSAPNGARHPTITVENPSKVHALLPQAKVQLSAGTWSRTLDAGFIEQRVGIGLVQPGKRRRFILPVDLPAGVSQVSASLDYRPQR